MINNSKCKLTYRHTTIRLIIKCRWSGRCQHQINYWNNW